MPRALLGRSGGRRHFFPPHSATIESTDTFAGIQSAPIETASTFASRNASKFS
ncbi:hypothetical protein HMPREF0970_00515 [Schaalia odontolytica F0309]|uniref:Uncharacterized protein n=1 Tax=Schaalia odontolytica F0309 TaxID=649742 RepID=D4TX58_9ACTO|nr:hypothetical protein HMPREF0970_00515 [Schaalia odontolytica F0309]